MLLLQNFDDERVTVDETLDFYKRLKTGGSLDENLRLFIIPQGASSFLQKADIDESGVAISALDGHFAPEILKYREAYNDRVLTFLATPKGDQKLSPVLNDARHTHAQDLFGRDDANKRILYRLYYANLHAESQLQSGAVPISKLSRLNKTFSQYAKHLAKAEKAPPADTIYETSVSQYGLWLIEKTAIKEKKMFEAAMAMSKETKLSKVVKSCDYGNEIT